jgi:heme/copper-type cytochrome/quinol oxidase subunit 2
MHSSITQSIARTRAPLSALTKLTIAALVGIAVSFVYLQAILLQRIEMPLPVFCILSLVLAGVVATGWRWAPLLGAGWSAFMFAGNASHIVYDLAHPEDTHQFGFVVVLAAILVVGIIAGLNAVVQNYREVDARRTPSWLHPSLIALAALVVGLISTAAIPRAAGAAVSPEVLATLPPVTLEAYNGGEIHVKAGQLTALRLENPDAVGHSFDVDELNIHIAMPSGNDSLALFSAAQPGRYLFYCAPHYDKASGSGMHGTLIVEP